MIRKIVRKFGFKKEIKYIGSQIRSEEALDILKDNANPFAISFALECFTRRNELLKPVKANINIKQIKEVLALSNIKNTILYILGLDPYEIVIKEFEYLEPYLTRFPVINLFQAFTPEHENLRISEAKNIEYYLSVRKAIEDIFKNSQFRPRPWENYRSLWYSKFGNEELKGIRI